MQGLWELLQPVGRTVDLQTMANRRYAVDASIWITQFVKAMRDEEGNMMKHAHILGFFRRIIRLLTLNIKPVFVFDGATPLLKRQTVMARRARRDQSKTKLRRVAEKVLLNTLQRNAVETIQRQKAAAPCAAAAAPSSPAAGSDSSGIDSDTEGSDDEMAKAIALSLGTASATSSAAMAAAAAAATPGDTHREQDLARAVHLSMETSQPPPLSCSDSASQTRKRRRASSANEDDTRVSNDDDEQEIAEAIRLSLGGTHTKCHHSRRLQDKGSVFQAHSSACTNEAEARRFVQAIKRDPQFASADHNMFASRIWQPSAEKVDVGRAATNELSCASPKGRWIEATDDDGEGGGARRILTDMQRMGCKNVCVVVSRWYGGQNLGGARFRHIVSAARGALLKLGYGEKTVDTSESESSSDDDEEEDDENDNKATASDSVPGGGTQRERGRSRKKNARVRTFFDRTGVVSQGGEARRPSGVDKKLWHKMLQSLRGAARPARRLAHTAATVGGTDATTASATSASANDLVAGLAAFGSGGDVDPETTAALRRLPPKTQLKLVRELQKSHERDAHQKFVMASKHNEADSHAPGAAMSDVSSLQLASYLQKAALKRREVAALTQLNNASQSDVELPRALTAAASGSGSARLPQNGAWGEDLDGGGLSLDQWHDIGTSNGSSERDGASKSMQVWDRDGRRISSRRLAGEADREYVLWKDPTAAINEEDYVVQSSNVGRQGNTVAASGLGNERGLSQKVRLIDELTASMVRAGQQKVIGGVLQSSSPPTGDADGDIMLVAGPDQHDTAGGLHSGGFHTEPSFGATGQTPQRQHVSPYVGDDDDKCEVGEQKPVEIDLTSEPEVAAASSAFAVFGGSRNGQRAGSEGPEATVASAAARAAEASSVREENREEALSSSEESDDGEPRPTMRLQLFRNFLSRNSESLLGVPTI